MAKLTSKDQESPSSSQVGSEDLGRQAVKTMSHLGLAAGFSMAMGLFIRLLLPRALGRDALGTLYFAESFSAMFFTVLPLGVTAYIVREIPVDHRQIKRILPTLLPATGVWACLIWLAMVTTLWFTNAEPTTIYCCGAMGVFNACIVFQRSILRRAYVAKGESARMARQETAIRLALVAMVVVCILIKSSVITVAAAYGVSEVVGVMYLVWQARRDGYLSDGFDFDFLAKIVRQSLPFFAVGALVELYGNINSTMLKFMVGTSEVAYFGAADKLKGMGLLLVPVMQAGLQPALAKAWGHDKAQFAAIVQHTVRILIVLSLPLTLGLMLLPDLVSDIIFGPEFHSSYRAVCYLSPVLTLTYLNVLMGSCLNIISDGRRFMIMTAASLVMNVSLNYLLIPLALARWGDGGAAAGSALSMVVSEIFVLLAIRSIFPVAVNFSRVFRMLLILAIPCVAVGYFYDIMRTTPSVWRMFGVAVTPIYLMAFGLIERSDWQHIRKFKF